MSSDTKVSKLSSLKGKIKNNKTKIIVIAIIAVAVLAIGSVLFFLLRNNQQLSSKADNMKILVFVNNDKDLKYISTRSKTPVLLSKSFDENINVEFNKSKTKIAYIKNRGLYLHEIGSEKQSDKIGVDVYYYKFINDNEIIYLDDDKNLFITSSGNKNKIDIDVTDIIANKDNLLIYTKEKEVYTYNINTKEKNAILKDYDSDKNIKVSTDLKQILYVSSDKELKIYNTTTKKSAIKENDVYDIVDSSDDFSNIIYTKLGLKKKYYDLFVNDDPKDNPVTKAKCTVYPFNTQIWDWEGGRTKKSDTKNNIYYIYDYYGYQTYLNEKGELYNVTEELQNLCKGIDPDKELKEAIKKSDVSAQFYNVYSITSKGNKQIATDIYQTIVFKDNILLYTKFNVSKKDKIKISTISSVNALKEIINEIKPTLYYSNDSKQEELLVNSYDNNEANINIAKGKIYVYEVSDKGKMNIYEYDANTASKEKISNNGVILDVNIMNYDVIYLDNINLKTYRGDLVGRKNGKDTNIDTDVYSSINSDGVNLYYYKDYDFDKKNGSFVINTLIKNKKKTINDVSLVLKSSKDGYYVFKDYSEASETYSLFLYRNDKQEPIEYNVTAYAYSE